MRLPMLRTFLILNLMTLISIIGAFRAFATEPVIRWEIENRFRYFKKASDFREIARVYGGLKTAENLQPSALQLEQALEREVIQKNFNGINGNDRLDGWAASIVDNTCGRELNHTHSSCQMQNGDRYLEPVTANIILYVD